MVDFLRQPEDGSTERLLQASVELRAAMQRLEATQRRTRTIQFLRSGMPPSLTAALIGAKLDGLLDIGWFAALSPLWLPWGLLAVWLVVAAVCVRPRRDA